MVLLSTIISACDGLSAAGTASGRRLKVLCLHGYGQTAAIFRDRSGGFRKPMKKSQFELFYVDGPFGCTKDGENEADADADVSRRAWWRGHSAQTTYPGWPEARDMLKDLWEREEMDGILGFSQGAGAAAMLSAELKPSFAIFVSGFVPRDEAAAASLLAGVRGVRSLHVIGAGDTLVEPARSRALAELFDGAEIVEHEGGHHTPSNAAVRARMVNFLSAEQLATAVRS